MDKRVTDHRHAILPEDMEDATIAGMQIGRAARGRAGEGNAMTFRESTLPEYVEWLRVWLESGGEPTHYYPYPWQQWTWLTAERDFTTGGECGSAAVHIIVPPGVRHAGGGLGHNRLYLMDGPGQRGGQVPVFADGVFMLLPGVREFAAAKEAEHRAWLAEHESERKAAEGRYAQSSIGQWRRGV